MFFCQRVFGGHGPELFRCRNRCAHSLPHIHAHFFFFLFWAVHAILYSRLNLGPFNPVQTVAHLTDCLPRPFQSSAVLPAPPFAPPSFSSSYQDFTDNGLSWFYLFYAVHLCSGRIDPCRSVRFEWFVPTSTPPRLLFFKGTNSQSRLSKVCVDEPTDSSPEHLPQGRSLHPPRSVVPSFWIIRLIW